MRYGKRVGLNLDSKTQGWIALGVILLLLIIGLIVTKVMLPPLTSLGMTDAQITGVEDCVCSNNNSNSRTSDRRNRKMPGYSLRYSFSYEGSSYSGAESGCTCSSFSIGNRKGESVKVFFDKVNPEDNCMLTDAMIGFIIILISVFVLVLLLVTKKQRDKGAGED